MTFTSGMLSFMARIAILTCSDAGARGERQDTSGDMLASRLQAAGHEISARALCPDHRDVIAAQLRAWCDSGAASIVITTGGTGLSPRDVTPEATRDVMERDVPGLPLALAVAGLEKTPFAVLSRGVAVTRGASLIVNLPGSPKACAEIVEILAPLLPHAIQILRGEVREHKLSDQAQ